MDEDERKYNDDRFVPIKICEERHRGMTVLREEIVRKNEEEHRSFVEECEDINVSIRELTIATNGKLERVHSRIDTMTMTMNTRFQEVLDKINTIQDKIKTKVLIITLSVIGVLVVAICSMAWQVLRPTAPEISIEQEKMIALDLAKTKLQASRNAETLEDIQSKINVLVKQGKLDKK